MKAVDFVVATTKNYVEQMPKAQRKKLILVQVLVCLQPQ